MSQVELIKELRALTQAGMKDCKTALEEANWDLEKAVDIVKVKGQNIVTSREGKVAAEGRVCILRASDITLDKDLNDKNLSEVAALVEVNCQTDFVANNTEFVDFTSDVTLVLLTRTLLNKPFTASVMDELRNSLIATTKENIVVRRWWVEEAVSPLAKVFTYTHSNNKLGVMLTLLAPSEEAASNPAFTELGNDLAMQVAAMNPAGVSVDRLDPEVLARQKTIFETQLTELKKPQAAWPKIMEGKLNKWYTEVCLLNQESVVTPKTTVQQVIAKLSKELGGEVSVVNFIRCQVGEGIEKAETNFAAEVASMAGAK